MLLPLLVMPQCLFRGALPGGGPCVVVHIVHPTTRIMPLLPASEERRGGERRRRGEGGRKRRRKMRWCLSMFCLYVTDPGGSGTGLSQVVVLVE